jgi:hypothetical protein
LGGWKGCLTQIEAVSGQEDDPAVLQQNSAGLAAEDQEVMAVGAVYPKSPASEGLGQEGAPGLRNSRTPEREASGQPDN